MDKDPIDIITPVLERWRDSEMWELEPFSSEISMALIGNWSKVHEVKKLLGQYRNGNVPMMPRELAQFLIDHA